MFGWRKSSPSDSWDANVTQWLSSGAVLGGMVGPNFNVSKEHKLCERFARKHPDSADFLFAKLRDPNPILAAYAFKCLIRVGDVDYSVIPADVVARTDTIDVQQGGCIRDTMTLRQFVRDYFGMDEPDDD